MCQKKITSPTDLFKTNYIAVRASPNPHHNLAVRASFKYGEPPLHPLLRKEGIITVFARSVATKQSHNYHQLTQNTRLPAWHPRPPGCRTGPDRILGFSPLEGCVRQLTGEGCNYSMMIIVEGTSESHPLPINRDDTSLKGGGLRTASFHPLLSKEGTEGWF